jgi:GNAT superfamily N-acetyltransferase
MDMIFADRELSRRLERCEAMGNGAIVEARTRLNPDSGAAALERAGAWAFFDGVGSQVTQTFGFGLYAEATLEDLEALERFLTDRGAEAVHEVSPLAGIEAFQILAAKAYRPVELTSVLYREIGEQFAEETRVRTRMAVGTDDIELYADTAAVGWSEFGVGPFVREMARVSASHERTSSFFAEIDGRAVGTGALVIDNGVALLAGASTIPSARNQGAQRALLEARLRHAKEQGCDLAMMCALPGSTSQRNAERQGFRIAYTRIKWAR